MRYRVCNIACKLNLPSYVRRRGAMYYFVRRVPTSGVHLPEFLGQAIWRKSLKTNDPDRARVLGAAELAWFNSTLSGSEVGRPSIEPEAAPAGVVPDQEMLRAIARNYFERELDRWTTRRLSAPAATPAGDQLDDEYALLEMEGEVEIEASVEAAVERYSKTYGLRVAHGSRERVLLSGALRQAWADLSPHIDAVMRREEFLPSPKTDLIRSAPKEIILRRRWVMRDLVKSFFSSELDIGPAFQKKIRDSANVWDGLGLSEIVIGSITNRDVTSFIELLRKLPANSSKRFPGLSALEAIECNRALEKPFPLLSEKTIFDGYVPALRKLLGHAYEERLIDRDPVTRLPKSRVSSTAARDRIFQMDELVRLFQQPVFAGCASLDRPNSPGRLMRDDHYHWGPIIALFTGARASEIAQLLVSRCDVDGGVPFIEFSLYDDAELKNANATRIIPVHSKLRAAGFLDFVRRQRAQGHERLFPEWEASKNDAQRYSSARAIRNFNEEVVPAFIKRTPLPTFHTLRANFKTELAIGKVPEQFQNALMGHAQKKEDPKYLGTLDLRHLAPELERAAFDELDLSGLSTRDGRKS